MTWLALVLGALAVVRLTRLVTLDTITDILRYKFRYPTVLTCGYCASMWVTGLVIIGWYLLPLEAWQVGCAGLGWSEIAGRLLAEDD